MVVSLLLFADVFWRGWPGSRQPQAVEPLPFSFVNLHTNDATGVGIIDSKTKEPVWTRLSFAQNGSETITYYFQGKSVMDVHLTSSKSQRRDVLFYDANGQLKLMWGDRSGLGLFTDRVFYDRDKQRPEVWFGEKWQPVVERSGLRGLVLNGNWQQLRFTNNIWVALP